MKKANATYSNRDRRRRPQALPKLPKRQQRLLPGWAPYAAAAFFTLAICFTLNFRAYRELTSEHTKHEELNSQIELITSENLNLQEEIYHLQNDPNAIAREAKKLGIVRKEKKVPVPEVK